MASSLWLISSLADLLQLFNTYADAGSYYDICLQIFFYADYRNTADIRATWQHLLEDLHNTTLERGTPLPYEAVADKVRSLGSRLRMSEIVFSVNMLLPMLERYALEHQRGVGPATWVIDLFLELGVAHESLYTVLESMHYTDEAPFHGSNRKYISRDFLYLIGCWFKESVRLGGAVFGSELVAERISEALLLLQQQGGLTPDQMQDAQELRARIENIIR